MQPKPVDGTVLHMHSGGICVRCGGIQAMGSQWAGFYSVVTNFCYSNNDCRQKLIYSSTPSPAVLRAMTKWMLSACKCLAPAHDSFCANHSEVPRTHLQIDATRRLVNSSSRTLPSTMASRALGPCLSGKAYATGSNCYDVITNVPSKPASSSLTGSYFKMYLIKQI